MFIIIQKSLPGTNAFDQPFENPLPELVKSASLLEKAGADFIIMPCHTAHLWIDEIRKAVTIPFYSIIENTAQTLLGQKNRRNKKILLLATKTTINSHLYQNEFKNSLITIITPCSEEQQTVDNAMLNVKAGILKNNQYIHQINYFLKKYQDKGISAILGCCTEIPLMYPYLKVRMEKLDPTLMLAKFAVQKAT